MLLPDLVFEDARPLKAVDSSERMAEVRGGCLATQTTRVNPGLRPMHFTHGSNGTSTGPMSYGTGALIEPIREPEAEGMGPLRYVSGPTHPTGRATLANTFAKGLKKPVLIRQIAAVGPVDFLVPPPYDETAIWAEVFVAV